MRGSQGSCLRHTGFKTNAMRLIVAILISALGLPIAVVAQPSPLTISIKSGAMLPIPREWPHMFPKLSQHAFYAEVQLEKELVTVLSSSEPVNRDIAISGAFYVGYWSGGQGKKVRPYRCFAIPCSRTLHTYNSFMAGARVFLNPSPVPLKFVNPFIGLSYHLVNATYVGSTGCCGTGSPDFPRRDFRYVYGAVEVGGRLTVPVGGRVAVTFEAQRYVRYFQRYARYFHDPTTKRATGQKSVTLGLSLLL